ncbi:MAG: hypothetical protein JNM65_11390 [Verrucomicrobiaceae bacterium]|nr:hypothetical protein [Verrucomicrobiaceae bacterium]
MEPFSPEDPLNKLLAQARKIEARSNFTQNVMRAARQTPQDHGWLAAVRAWWAEAVNPSGKWAFAAGVAAAIVLTVAVLQTQPQSAPQIAEKVIAPVVEELPVLPAAETPWETAYQTEALLAVDDTSQFTDSEISFLLY